MLSALAMSGCGEVADGTAHPDIVGATHRYAQVGETRWHYLEGGEGDAVVFLHGLPETSFAWRRAFNWLTVGNRVVAVDLEGFGLSRTTSTDFSVAAMADRLLAFLEAIEVDRFHLVGHDFGAIIGARTASQAGDRLLSYAHVSGPLLRYDLTRNPDFRDFRNDPDSVPDLLRNPEIFVRRTYEMGVVGGPAALDQPMIDRYTADLENWDALTSIAQYFSQLDVSSDWTLGPDAAANWGAIQAPVLFVLGGRDLMLPLEEFHDIETIVPPLDRLAVLEGAGHYPHEEDPIAFGDALYDFLQGH
ncbi:MAG: alpha/beta fold hydrolase [Acidobacteria bacterium]|nr:alpha/beta fold hydrolase [Acidobacteriota bacterium]